MSSPTLPQILNAGWIVSSGGELYSSERFQCFFTGCKKHQKNHNSSCFRMCINDASLSRSACVHPIFSASSTPHDANAPQTKKSTCTQNHFSKFVQCSSIYHV